MLATAIRKNSDGEFSSGQEYSLVVKEKIGVVISVRNCMDDDAPWRHYHSMYSFLKEWRGVTAHMREVVIDYGSDDPTVEDKPE